jgi:hypothetical protein
MIGDRHLVLFGDGDAVVVSAGEEPLRFLLVSGKPIGEPIVEPDRDDVARGHDGPGGPPSALQTAQRRQVEM